MAKLRLTAYCFGCETVVDVTIHPSKVQAVVSAINDAHRPSCFEYEETDTDGSNQEGAGAPATTDVAQEVLSRIAPDETVH